MVAKPRIVVTFGLVLRLRISKMSTVTGIGRVVVAKPRIVVTFDSSRVFVSQKCQQSQGSGGRGRETQNCHHFWTRLAPSRLKSVNSHRDPGGSWSRNPELSSLLDSSGVSASQKCQQSQRSGGSWLRNPELSSLLDSSRVFASQKC